MSTIWQKELHFHHLSVSFFSFPKLSTLKITLSFNSKKQRQSHTVGNPVLCPATTDSISSHSTHPGFCCPLKSHSGSHLASCSYTLLSPGSFSQSTINPVWGVQWWKQTISTNHSKWITIQIPLQIPIKRTSKCPTFLLESPWPEATWLGSLSLILLVSISERSCS